VTSAHLVREGAPTCHAEGMYLYRGLTREQWRARQRVASLFCVVPWAVWGVAHIRHADGVEFIALLGLGIAMGVTFWFQRIVNHPERYFTLTQDAHSQ